MYPSEDEDIDDVVAVVVCEVEVLVVVEELLVVDVAEEVVV